MFIIVIRKLGFLNYGCGCYNNHYRARSTILYPHPHLWNETLVSMHLKCTIPIYNIYIIYINTNLQNRRLWCGAHFFYEDFFNLSLYICICTCLILALVCLIIFIIILESLVLFISNTTVFMAIKYKQRV